MTDCDRANTDQENLADAQRFSEMMRTLYECPKPTLVRVQGAAYGGGVGLICACDIAIAADTAKFAVTEARVGILPSAIAPYLINAVGLRQARRLALTTEILDANTAREIGLLHQVVQSDKLDESIETIIGNILRGGPGALAEIKTLFRALGVGPIGPETRKITAETIARVRGQDEAREGFTAFFEKRPPSWIASHD